MRFIDVVNTRTHRAKERRALDKDVVCLQGGRGEGGGGFFSPLHNYCRTGEQQDGKVSGQCSCSKKSHVFYIL